MRPAASSPERPPPPSRQQRPNLLVSLVAAIFFPLREPPLFERAIANRLCWAEQRPHWTELKRVKLLCGRLRRGHRRFLFCHFLLKPAHLLVSRAVRFARACWLRSEEHT